MLRKNGTSGVCSPTLCAQRGKDVSGLASGIRSFFGLLSDIVKSFQPKDILDILLVAVLVYGVLCLVRDTRVGQVMRGVLFLVIIYMVSNWLNMTMVSTILRQVFGSAVVVLIILFQPELRKVLEQVGRNNVGRSIMGVLTGKGGSIDGDTMYAVEETVEAVGYLKQLRMGALIVFEKNTKLNEIIGTGTAIVAEPSAQLIGNIFFNKAPLHDGALIIRQGKIQAAGCILPLTAQIDVSADLGTRHRAALGLSEDTDAVVVVVSEETGQISIAEKGQLSRDYTPSTLRTALHEKLFYEQEEGGKASRNPFKRWLGKGGGKAK